MLITGKNIDDLKTERKNISPPLPMYLRLVPILFYVSIAMGILLNALFAMQLGSAARNMGLASQDLALAKGKIAELDAERKALEAEVKKASDISAWVESARPLQPLVVNIARSIDPEFSIVELRIDRDADDSAQLRLNMRFSGDSTKQLDLTLDRIAAEKFRTYTPQQTIAKGEIEYKATLIWQPGQTIPASDGAVTP